VPCAHIFLFGIIKKLYLHEITLEMKIVADDKIPFLKGVLEPFAEVIYLPGKQISNDILKDADAILIRTRTKCTESLLEGTSVKFIGTATIGFDHIDLQYCHRKKIAWTNAPGCNSSSVQQYIAAALLRLSSENQFRLCDKTLGIVGVGNVGSKVEKFARALGMNVLLNDPPRERAEGKSSFVNLDTIISDSDIITLHVPLNVVGKDISYHLFDCDQFKRIKKSAWLLNTSRGEVVETNEFKKALYSEKLAGAVIDVWENEPDIDTSLMNLSHLSTPHIAGYSTDGKANGTAMIVNSLSRFFDIPLQNWYPGNIPDPVSPAILIDCKGKSEEDIYYEAVNHTYNIYEDSSRFRNSPPDFEKLRGDYPLRREFSSYNVDLKDGSDKIRNMLDTIGFKS
jgi:erythronate-4-phosphate dehydrogenase